MFNGTTLVERIKRVIEKQMSILETWSEGEGGGLNTDQLDQLKTLALIARQLDLDNVEPTFQPGSAVPPTGTSDADLLAEVMGNK